MVVKELGHVVLYVRDIEVSRRFYRDVLGWEEVAPSPLPGMAAFTSGRTHHELLLLEVGSDAKPVPSGRRLGMYHFGVKVGDSDAELREMLARLQDRGVPITGTADHGVSHSLYVRDPDGNEIELYVDVPDVDWRSDPTVLFRPPRPLQL